MRYQRVCRAAGVIQKGDYLELTPLKNTTIMEQVRSVRFMMFNGEFEGKQYHNTSVVRVETGTDDTDRIIHIIPAATKVKLWVPNK